LKIFVLSENGILLVFLVFLQANRANGAAKSIRFLSGKKSKHQQKPAAQTPDQNQNKVLAKIECCLGETSRWGPLA